MEGSLTTEELIEFYNARDEFVGRHNGRDPDVRVVNVRVMNGFKRLKKSRVPEAVFVCRLFHGDVPKSVYDVTRVLEPLAHQGNAIAMCYVGILDCDADFVYQSAVIDFPYASGCMCERTSGGEQLEWARRSATGGDRFGLYWLGVCHEFGIGCDRDIAGAIAAYKESARLGCAQGMFGYGQIAYSKEDPERYEWFGKCSVKQGFIDSLFEREVREHVRRSEPNTRVLYTMGRMISMYGRRPNVSHNHFSGGLLNRDTKEVLLLYLDCIICARKSVNTWTLCARRLGLYRDLVGLIGTMVWADRHALMVPPAAAFKGSKTKRQKERLHKEGCL